MHIRTHDVFLKVSDLKIENLSEFYFKHNSFFFLNKFLFLFSSNLQTLNSKFLKKKFFLQENDQKTNKQTKKLL